MTIKDKVIRLTRKEFDLLTALITEKGRLLNVPYLLKPVWGYDPASYNDPHTWASTSLRSADRPRNDPHNQRHRHGYKFE